MGVFALPEELALKAGLRKGDVRIPAGYEGSGDYMASLEVTHQLHCVVSILIFIFNLDCQHFEDGLENYHNGKEIPFSEAQSPKHARIRAPTNNRTRSTYFILHSTSFHLNTDSNRTSSAKPSGSTTHTTKTSATNSVTRNPSSKRIYTTASKPYDKQ